MVKEMFEMWIIMGKYNAWNVNWWWGNLATFKNRPWLNLLPSNKITSHIIGIVTSLGRMDLVEHNKNNIGNTQCEQEHLGWWIGDAPPKAYHKVVG